MNTRTYPRTAVMAFPKTCDYASALERPAPNPYPLVLWLALGLGAVVAFVVAVLT